ncbi:MAG: hypothetical protein IJH36_02565, partial [Clostridia bacterium]|nr:hypothetical protein [Clostridia bacterium]
EKGKGDIDAAADVAVDPTSPILWTYNKNRRTMVATATADTTKKDSKVVTVNQKDITVAAAYSDGTNTKPTKNYDGSMDIKPSTGTWTFTTTDAATDDTISAIGLTTGKVTYSAAGASDSDVNLLFNGNAADATDINGQFTITVDGDSDGSRAGSYKITSVTGTTTGTINKRPLTLTQIENIPSVVQYSTPDQSAEQTATNKATGTALKATFAAAGGSDANGTGTGVVGTGEAAETISVKFKYHYLDTNTVGTLTDNTNTKLELADISTTNTNYDLTATDVTAVGSVTAATVESVGITAPTIFGKTATQVQYGDAFDFTGLSVAVNYSGNITETYTPNGYDTTTGAITKWNKHSSRTGVADADVNAADIPFGLKWNNLSPGYKKGDKLAVHAADDGVTLKAELKADTSKTATTTEKLVVGPRQVTPAASITAPDTKVSKVYDSTTTYSTTAGTGYNTSTGAIEIALTGAATSYTAAADKDASGNYQLPAELGTTATYAYNSANVADADKINITAIALDGTLIGGDALTNYILTANTGNVPAEITKRDVIVTNVRYIDAIAQGSAVAAASADITTNNANKPYAEVAASTPVAGSDVLDLSIDYTYTSSAIASASDGSGGYLDDIDVTISSVAAKAGTATAANYNVYADMDDNTAHSGTVKTTGHGTVTPATVTMTVTNPTQLQGTDYTFGTPLNVDGLTVNVKYGSTGDGTDYIAKVSGDPATVTWHKDSASGDVVTATDLPFTYA